MDDLTKKTADEKAYETLKFITKSLVQLVPGFGGTASEFFDLVVANPAIIRRDRFMMELAQRLDSLVEQGRLELKDFLNNEEASILLTQSIQTALRSRGKLKIEALKNATINGLLHKPGEGHLGLLVVGLIDRLAEPHISMLREFSSLPETDKKMTYDKATMLGVSLSTTPAKMTTPRPTINLDKGKQQYFDDRNRQINQLIVSDLMSMGLLRTQLELPGGGVSKWSTDPAKNGIDHLALTDLGKLVINEIEPTSQSSAPP